uniref:Uncharacterized protein n=1 Tax=Cucumis melo TaxID=3656 RepID=A0A9I9EEQ6_CUCME
MKEMERRERRRIRAMKERVVRSKVAGSTNDNVAATKNIDFLGRRLWNQKQNPKSGGMGGRGGGEGCNTTTDTLRKCIGEYESQEEVMSASVNSKFQNSKPKKEFLDSKIKTDGWFKVHTSPNLLFPF